MLYYMKRFNCNTEIVEYGWAKEPSVPGWEYTGRFATHNKTAQCPNDYSINLNGEIKGVLKDLLIKT